MYVAARVEEQRVFNVRCPHEGCGAELFEADLKRLADCGLLDPAVPARFTDLRARDFTARAKEFTETSPHNLNVDYATLQRLWETTRLCPRCSLAIERSQGCNSFYCICGHHFNYAAAPRAVGNGIKNYHRVISLAQSQSMPLHEAEKYGQDINMYHKSSKIAAQLDLSVDSAHELLKKAMAGDDEARARIRKARQDGATMTGTTEALAAIAA